MLQQASIPPRPESAGKSPASKLYNLRVNLLTESLSVKRPEVFGSSLGLRLLQSLTCPGEQWSASFYPTSLRFGENRMGNWPLYKAAALREDGLKQVIWMDLLVRLFTHPRLPLLSTVGKTYPDNTSRKELPESLLGKPWKHINPWLTTESQNHFLTEKKGVFQFRLLTQTLKPVFCYDVKSHPHQTKEDHTNASKDCANLAYLWTNVSSSSGTFWECFKRALHPGSTFCSAQHWKLQPAK